MPDERIAIVKCAAGGTGIARSIDYSDYIPALSNFDDNGNNWHPPSNNLQAGLLYRKLIDNVRDAVSALELKGLRWKLAGCIWMQGEHEAGINQKMAQDYKKLLAGFISSIRTDLNAPSLLFAIGQVNSHSWAYGDIVRDAQASFCREDANAILVKTTDLSREGSGGLAHFDADGMLKLGHRFATAINQISVDTLLKEMIDRDRIAGFPKPAYECKQASSYNRASVSPDKPGWFADSDGVSAIRVEEVNGRKEWVLMEDTGPGVITKIWAVCFYYGLKNTTGVNINFYLDGETEPTISTNFFRLVKGQDFIKPPFAQESTRAGNLYFPIPYAKSCKITMDKKVFYNIINYRKYAPDTPVKTFTMDEFRKTADVQKKVAAILNNKPDAKGEVAIQESQLQSGGQLVHILPTGSGVVRQLEIQLSDTGDIAQALRSVVLVGKFDGVQSIWAPVGDFFCNIGKIQPYDLWERSARADGTMVCRWVMPYQSRGKIVLKNLGKQTVNAKLSVTTGPWKWTENSMHFYASWRMDDPTPTFPLFDWNFLDARGSGVIVDDEWTVLNPRQGWWGEGDEKIYIDDDIEKNFPSHFGTGSEDYYGWAGGVVPTPADEFANLFLGNVIVGDPRSMGYNVCTRTRVLDAIPFSKRIKFDFESSCGTRQRWHHLQYAQTTFWYGRPGVKHNRPPLPKMASSDLPTLSGLQAIVEKAKKDQYVVDGALEAEFLEISKSGGSIVEDFAKIAMWGEVSSGGMKNLWFEKTGDFVEFKITEQFEKSRLIVSAAVGRNCGMFDIYVNGQRKVTQDMYSEHAGITTPNVDLGHCKPVNNAFTVRFEFKGANNRAGTNQGKYALGLDYFYIPVKSVSDPSSGKVN